MKMILDDANLGTISRGSGADQPVDFPVELLLDPNKRYAMKLWVESAKSASVSMSSLVFSVTPADLQRRHASPCRKHPSRRRQRASGAAAAQRTAPPRTAALRLRCRRIFSASRNPDANADALPGGASCDPPPLHRQPFPAGAQTAQLKLSLSGNSCKVYDYALM